MFLDNTLPAAPGLESIFTMLRSNLGLGILAAVVFAVLFIIMFKLTDIIGYFKERADKKDEIELKKIEEVSKNSDRLHELLRISNEVAEKTGDKVSEAIEAFKDASMLSESRLSEKIQNSETRLSEKINSVEIRLSDKISAVGK